MYLVWVMFFLDVCLHLRWLLLISHLVQTELITELGYILLSFLPVESKHTLTDSAVPILRPLPLSTARQAAAWPSLTSSPVNSTKAIPSEPPVVGHFSISTVDTWPYTEKNVVICASVMSGDKPETNTLVNGFGPTEC